MVFHIFHGKIHGKIHGKLSGGNSWSGQVAPEQRLRDVLSKATIGEAMVTF